ncbi:hypothetical protein [Ornithinibacillus xuwenensis]|uniref:Uncharacterized protein n=1 Tax=Ornithinibacillus xuwenensis TaxID=3144668 RepID=A0ABU9XEZ4_9BACI
MLNDLMNMDEGLKNFLCKRIFEDRIATQSEIIQLAVQERYEETEVYRGLEIFLYNSLIDQVQDIMPSPIKGDFLISDNRYYEFKANGYL